MDPQTQIERLQGEVDRLSRLLAVAQAEVAHFRRKDELHELKDGGAVLDVAEELKDAADMDAAEWARHVARVKTRYARAA
jgi:hypothetical protein